MEKRTHSEAARGGQVTFVVHGIGAPKAADTHIDEPTAKFATHWAASNHVEKLDVTSHLLPSSNGETTQYHVIHSRIAGSPHRVVELQWADLSTVATGRFGWLIALFETLFGLRVIAKAADSARPMPGRAASRASDLLFAIMEGPVLAINIVLAIAVLLQAFLVLSESSLHWLLIGTSTLSCLISFSSSFRQRPLSKWLLFFGVYFLFVPVLEPVIPLQVPLDRLGASPDLMTRYALMTVAWVPTFWLAAAICVVFLTGNWLFRRRRLSDEKQRSFDLLVTTSALAFRIWSLILLVLWILLATLVGTRLGTAGGALSPELLEYFMRAASRTVGFNWLLMLPIILVAGWCFWSFSRDQNEQDRRVIIAKPLMWTINVTAAAMGSIWLLAIFGALSGTRLDAPLIDQLLTGGGWLLTTVTAFLLYSFRDQVRCVFDFAIDIVNYLQSMHGNNTLRTKIFRRFDAIISQTLSHFQPDRVAFVSHSQGTVWTTAYLANSPPAIKASLVTMGSPISHLYDYYFGGLLWKGRWPMSGTVGEWCNLYFTGDIVGQEVARPDSVDAEEGLSPQNVNMGEGSHTDYFISKTVYSHLFEKKIVPSLIVQELTSPPK